MKIFDIILIVICIAAYILISRTGWKWLKYKEDKDFIMRAFGRGNIIAEGSKGSGKDLLFSYIANNVGPHYANIRYNDYTELRDVSFFNLDPNNFSSFINGKITVTPKMFKEGYDFFVSDAGVILPSHADPELKSLFPSFPIVYALGRQLANMNIHCNSQSYERIFKPLREQADGFFRCHTTQIKRRFGVTIATTEITFYESERGIAARLVPYDKGVFAPEWQKEQAADQYHKYGTVRALVLLQILEPDGYDSRAYHRKVYGINAPNN